MKNWAISAYVYFADSLLISCHIATLITVPNEFEDWCKKYNAFILSQELNVFNRFDTLNFWT